LDFKKEDYAPDFDWDQKCTKCGSEMKLRFGKFGPFLGCTGYPKCRTIINIPKVGEVALDEASTDCPAIGCDGKITAKKSRFGKTFYSCSNYPDCDVIANTLEQLEEKYANHPKTPYISKKKKSAKKTTAKKSAAKKTASPKQKAYNLSPELQAVVQEAHLSRPEVTKKLWEYIKANHCQDPNNKRLIKPDALLEKVFGSKDPVDMMKLAKIISPHLTSE
jgi:DNA topoisomerase-1